MPNRRVRASWDAALEFYASSPTAPCAGADEAEQGSWLFQGRGMFFLSQRSGLGEMMEGLLNFCSGQR